MDFFVFLMIAIGIFAAAAASNSRSAAAWGAAAKVLGISFAKKNAFSNPRLSGTIDGYDLSVFVRSTGNSKVTRYVVSYPTLGIDLEISRKSGLAKIGELFGGGAEPSDDPFEQLASVKTSDPQQLPLFLTPQVREVISDLLINLPAAKVTDDQITFDKRNIERQANTIVVTSRRLIAAAQAITGRRRTSEPEERAPLPPDPYAPSMPMPTLSPPEPPPPVPERTTDPTSTLDTTTPSYDTMTPSSIEPEPATYEPLMPSYEVPSMSAPPGEAPPSPQPPAGELDAGTIGTALFGGNMLSFQAATTFDEQYFGRNVRWPGKVTKRTDAQVEAEVGTIDTSLFGPIQIGALVEGGAPVKEGDQVIVEGTLAAVDTLERTFTVDGTVKRA